MQPTPATGAIPDGNSNLWGSAASRVRLAEVIASLSLGIDLGFGQPMEHTLRQCLIALRLAEGCALEPAYRAVVYYTALLINVACHSDAHEQAKWFGDDIALKAGKYEYGLRGIKPAIATLKSLGSGHPPMHRFRLGLEFVLSGHREVDDMVQQHSSLARQFAEGLGLSDEVSRAVGSSYENWDGRGWPGEMKGEQIPLAARIAQTAEFLEVAHRVGGIDAATALARKLGGSQFDPHLAEIVCARPAEIFGGLEDVNRWDAVIASEPALAVFLSPDQFDKALVAIADFVDLKSPYMLGHARAVADLATQAARVLDLPVGQVLELRRAALVHGFGRLGVSNSIWDKKGPLASGEWERVRMSPYLTERMLNQSPALRPIGAIAVQHRERMDGSGYPRGLPGSVISRQGRILAAAEAYRSMLEPRPHREAHTPGMGARLLRGEAEAGLLDPESVEAVLRAAGHSITVRREQIEGLTERELEVFQLLVLGLSNKQIAEKLVISPKTAGNHIEHIYSKIGATSRATACLFAMQHGLVPAEALEA